MIPNNQEHLEAAQEAVNQERKRQKSLMTEEDRAKLELIEEVSQKLENAKIPFILFARPNEKGFYQFHRMTFEADMGSPVALKEGSNNHLSFLSSLSFYLSRVGYFIGLIPPPKS